MEHRARVLSSLRQLHRLIHRLPPDKQHMALQEARATTVSRKLEPSSQARLGHMKVLSTSLIIAYPVRSILGNLEWANSVASELNKKPLTRFYLALLPCFCTDMARIKFNCHKEKAKRNCHADRMSTHAQELAAKLAYLKVITPRMPGDAAKEAGVYVLRDGQLVESAGEAGTSR